MERIEHVGEIVLQLGRADQEGVRVWVCRIRGTRVKATDNDAFGAARGAMKAAKQWQDRGYSLDPWTECR